MFFKAHDDHKRAEEDEACNLLSDRQRASIHTMLGDQDHASDDGRNAVLDKIFVECDEPSEDPSVTCFLTPDSWVDGELHSEKWLCMDTPSPSRQPGVMDGEDSY